jgi:quinol-cytochrome oxidoreductase complex cytochrome b subunit
MNPDTGIKTWQWVVTVIVIIVLIVIGVMVFGNKGSQTPAENTNPGDTSGTAQGTNNIIMSDQYPGNVVYVSSVSLQTPGWVVIHKDNAGQPGAVIGSVFVPAGVSPAKVTLTQPVIDGGVYYAMIHSDNGDSKFDAATDLPLKDAAGNVIMKVFHGSVSAGANIKG